MGGIGGLHAVTGLRSCWDHTQVVVTAALRWLETGSSGRTSWMASGEAAFYVGEQREYVALYCGTDEEPAGSLWIRVSRQTNVGHVVCVCYKPPGQIQIHRPWSSWGTLPMLLPAGGMAQQGTNDPECFSCVLMATS